MNKFSLFAISIFVCLNALHAQGLKDAYKDHFMMGVATSGYVLSDTAKQRIILDNFNSFTCENEMKPISVHPAEGVWRWEAADRMANFCRAKGIKMRGHTLCWHAQFCDWMFTDSLGNPVTKEVFYARLREHIHTVVHRYKDIVYCWDVVNEAMSDGWQPEGHEKNPYRESRLFKLCGDEFIAKAFIYAREADANALLFYNDYNASDPAKSERIYHMVEKMQAAGVPIDGIGMQGHCNIFYPDAKWVDAAIGKYAKLVKHIHITEMDMRVNQEHGGNLEHHQKGFALTDSLKVLHTQRYADLFEVFRRHSDVIDCVTFWNLGDKDSWLGADTYPLLFDKDYQPKQAYFVVRDKGKH